MIRVAYLNSRYPALSHTFIEREIRAVRACGVEVHTFSVRRPRGADLLTARHGEEARTTSYLLDARRILAALARAVALRPWALLRTLAAGQRLSPPGLRARMLHVVYALEALVLAGDLRRRGLSHCHVHMADNGAAVALLATAFDPARSFSLTIHGSEEFFDVKAFALARKVSAARFVRCISSFCRAQVMIWSDPGAWSKLHVVHTGIDPADFVPRRTPAADGALRLLTVGRLDPIKGYDHLLEACRRLAEEGVAFRLRMVGDGPVRPHLEALVRALGLGEHVALVGSLGQEQLQREYEQADVMVVSSFMEGLPVVLMEAMAKEVAVVSTGVAGIPELVVHGASGLLALPASADDLRQHLAALAADRALAASLARRGRERVVAEFSIHDVGAQMAALFARYLAEAPGASAGEPAAAEPQRLASRT